MSDFLMGIYTLDHLNEGSLTEKGFTNGRMEKFMMGNGKMD